MRWLLFILISGCGYFKHDKSPVAVAVDPLDAARAKAAVYLQHADEAKDKDGFIHLGCDSVMFTALYVAAGGSANVTAAEGEPGQWFRTPAHDCYDQAEAASDISEDMLLGLMTWFWQTHNVSEAQKMLDYARANSYIMGRGDLTRTIMRPPLASTLKAILGAETHEAALTGYEAHLQVLHTLLDSSILGASSAGIATLKSQAERQPRNALFQAAYHLYTDGDQTAAGLILADDGLWPPDRLPTEKDRCEEYLFQRDDDPRDWSPCDQGQGPHSGTDLIFTLMVAEGRFRHK